MRNKCKCIGMEAPEGEKKKKNPAGESPRE